jgi:hypothetical protein
MNIRANFPQMVIPDQLNRRTVIKGVRILMI